MTPSSPSDIDALGAPAEDSETLIWPDPRALVRMAAANRRQRDACDFSLLGLPVREWTTDLPTERDSPLVFMAGHQPAFYHPGVWAKNVVASALAEQAGGAAQFLLVDSDVPHRIAIDWPDDSAPTCRVRQTTAVGIKDWRSYEHIADRASIDYGRMFETIPATLRGGSDTILEDFERGFLSPPRGEGDRQPGYVERWWAGMSAADAALGLATPSCRRIRNVFSHRCSAEPTIALPFVAHLILEAPRFASAYTSAVATYRQRRGIRGRQHPIPDLLVTADRVELPFWLTHHTGERQRLAVTHDGVEVVHLWAAADSAFTLRRDELARDPVRTLAENLNGWHIRPRALPQTMYARLFACDLFIHGIGGAKYDQITDDIIRDFFGIEPPAYACVSATLRLPLPTFGVDASRITASERTARDIRHNPQRHLSPSDLDDRLKALVAARVQGVEANRRLRATGQRHRAARRAAYEQIQRANGELLRLAPGLLTTASEQLHDLRAKLVHDRVARSRDWFFAIYPKAKISKLRDALQADIR